MVVTLGAIYVAGKYNVDLWLTYAGTVFVDIHLIAGVTCLLGGTCP